MAISYLHVSIHTHCSFELRLTILMSHIFSLTLYLKFYLCKLEEK